MRRDKTRKDNVEMIHKREVDAFGIGSVPRSVASSPIQEAAWTSSLEMGGEADIDAPREVGGCGRGEEGEGGKRPRRRETRMGGEERDDNGEHAGGGASGVGVGAPQQRGTDHTFSPILPRNPLIAMNHCSSRCVLTHAAQNDSFQPAVPPLFFFLLALVP